MSATPESRSWFVRLAGAAATPTPDGGSGLPDARHDSLWWNIAAPSCFYTVLVLFRLQDFRSLFANGESGVRHRSVSSAAASPCEQPGGRRLRVSGGAEMDRGERRHTAGGLRAPQVFGCLSDGVQPDLCSSHCTLIVLLRHLLKGDSDCRT